MKNPRKHPKGEAPSCRSCRFAVKVKGKGTFCGHESAQGVVSVEEARWWPRWVEVVIGRDRCGSAGVFFERKPRANRVKDSGDGAGSTPLPMPGNPVMPPDGGE